MTVLSPARRVSSLAEVTQPGDYYGPVTGSTGPAPGVSAEAYAADPSLGLPAVFFLLPTAAGPNPLWRADPAFPANGIHHVTMPPHVFRECPDGSLEIRESIGAYGTGPVVQGQYVWHGYLDEGNVWRQV